MTSAFRRTAVIAVVVAALTAPTRSAAPDGPRIPDDGPRTAGSPPRIAQDPPTTTFRSRTSGITVDVTVRDKSRRAITGLEADDFQVYDNGVLQRVDSVSYGKLPIDVTVALDVSHSVTGALLDRLRQGVVQLMRDLGREDRLKLVLFNMRISRTTDFTTDVKVVESAIRTATAGGGTALLDAVSVALVSAASPDRRQLIVFFTDGNDTISTTTSPELTAVAQRTRATLVFVMPSAVPMRVVRNPLASGTSVRVMAPSPNHALFATLARETGGDLLPVAPDTNLTSTFRTVLNEFRSAYVLYYTARGVEREGYHKLEVKTRRDGAVIQARRGYFGS